MENSDKHLEIISYIYGELNSEERKAFERKMAEDAGLRKEVESLMDTRTIMKQLPAKKEVDPSTSPVVFIPRQESGNWVKPILAVAATIVILLMVGYFTRFSIRYDEKGLLVGYTKDMTGQGISKSEVESLIHDALISQQMVYDQEIAKTRDSLQQYFGLLVQLNQQQNPDLQKSGEYGISEAELQKQLAGWQSSNRALLQTYLTTVNEQQQEYLKEAFIQFSDYLQDQRDYDLIMIRQNLMDMKDYQDQQKRETNEMLASIMKTVRQDK